MVRSCTGEAVPPVLCCLLASRKAFPMLCSSVQLCMRALPSRPALYLRFVFGWLSALFAST
eukprot:6175312-Pleurochrysis_carterae.AAC.6